LTAAAQAGAVQEVGPRGLEGIGRVGMGGERGQHLHCDGGVGVGEHFGPDYVPGSRPSN
jgi:hypothetical protein